MRIFTILAFSLSTLALSACGMLSDDAAPTPAEAAQKAAPVSASASEEKEMAAVMGADEKAAEEPVSDAPPAAEESAAVDVAEVEAVPPAPVAGAPKECPGVEVLPDTRSITYFDDPEGKPTGKLIARASLVDIKGGCDYSADGVIVDIDMIMQGKITDHGRYEGRKDLEAFMTFPYFVAVMDPSGKMIDKKIMATAMRFQPEVDDLDHAEKITQNIPLPDISKGPEYTITVGFQLNRAQLDYNRGSVSESKKEPVKEEKLPEKKAEEKKADAKPADATPAEAPKAGAKTETAPTPSATPAAKESSDSRMKPIVE